MTLQLNKERLFAIGNLMNEDVFLASWPDAASVILGTNYLRFESNAGIDGLAKENGDRLDILAVHSSDPSTGQFRRFIQDCKAHYRTICIWSVWNEFLPAVLERYGFEVAFDFQAGQNIQGWRWDKESA